MRNLIATLLAVFSFSLLTAEDSFIPIGISAGWNNADHGQFGFEASIVGVQLFEGRNSDSSGIGGVYGDFINGGDLRRFSFGPELLIFNNGLTPILDGGYALIFKDGKHYNGICGRITLLFGKGYFWLPAMPYYRFTKVFGSDSIKECGVLIKFPVDMFN